MASRNGRKTDLPMGKEGKGYDYICKWCGKAGTSEWTPNQLTHPGECKRLYEQKLRQERQKRKRGPNPSSRMTSPQDQRGVGKGVEGEGAVEREIKGRNRTIESPSTVQSGTSCSEIGTNLLVNPLDSATISTIGGMNDTNTPKEGKGIPDEGSEGSETRTQEPTPDSRRASLPERSIRLTAEVEVNADELLDLLREVQECAREGRTVPWEIARKIEELTKGLLKESGEEREGSDED